MAGNHLRDSPDQMPVAILQQQQSIQEAHLLQVKIVVDRKAMCKKAGVQDDPQSHLDLLQRSEERDAHLKATLIPQLSQLEERAQKWSQIITENVPVSVEAWWEQPAQHVTPWVLVKGLTFEQWMQRFRVIQTQVHKKHMQRQKTAVP